MIDRGFRETRGNALRGRTASPPGWVVTPPQVPSLPVEGRSERFPVRRVYCVGRNYAAHAVEMGHDPDREAPFFFQKNADDLDPSGTFPYPSLSEDVHHEVELYLALGSGGVELSDDDALNAIWGFGLAIDMTRRDLQGAAKAAGRPWEVGKAFARSAPAGPVHAGRPPGDGQISLAVNGSVRQDGNLNQMIWKPVEIVAELSRYFSLAAGDVVLTGTPAGVGPVQKGDRLHATCEGLSALDVEVI